MTLPAPLPTDFRAAAPPFGIAPVANPGRDRLGQAL